MAAVTPPNVALLGLLTSCPRLWPIVYERKPNRGGHKLLFEERLRGLLSVIRLELCKYVVVTR